MGASAAPRTVEPFCSKPRKGAMETSRKLGRSNRVPSAPDCVANDYFSLHRVSVGRPTRSRLMQIKLGRIE